MIDLYYWPTPNGRKVSILLEELNVPYKIIKIDITKNNQFSKEYTKISPSNKIPPIIDHETKQRLFESSAISAGGHSDMLAPFTSSRRVYLTPSLDFL